MNFNGALQTLSDIEAENKETPNALWDAERIAFYDRVMGNRRCPRNLTMYFFPKVSNPIAKKPRYRRYPRNLTRFSFPKGSIAKQPRVDPIVPTIDKSSFMYSMFALVDLVDLPLDADSIEADMRRARMIRRLLEDGPVRSDGTLPAIKPAKNYVAEKERKERLAKDLPASKWRGFTCHKAGKEYLITTYNDVDDGLSTADVVEEGRFMVKGLKKKKKHYFIYDPAGYGTIEIISSKKNNVSTVNDPDNFVDQDVQFFAWFIFCLFFFCLLIQ